MKAIATISFETQGQAWPGIVRVHEFNGEFSGAETPTWFGYERHHVEGMSVGEFFTTLMTAHHHGLNKVVVTATLQTWFWVAVVGQNGKMRGKPQLFRHMLPDKQPAMWVLMQDREHRGSKTRYILVPYPRTPRVYGYEQWDNGCRAGVLVPVGHPARYAQDVTDDLLAQAKRNGTVNASHPGFDWGRNLEDFPNVYWGTRTDPETGQEVDATTHRRILLRNERAGSGILFHHILRERGIETVS